MASDSGADAEGDISVTGGGSVVGDEGAVAQATMAPERNGESNMVLNMSMDIPLRLSYSLYKALGVFRIVLRQDKWKVTI